MRIVSQDKKYDLPYEQTAIINKRVYGLDDNKQTIYVFHIIGLFQGEKYILGEYSSQEKVDHILAELRKAYVKNNTKHIVATFLKDEEVELPEEAAE